MLNKKTIIKLSLASFALLGVGFLSVSCQSGEGSSAKDNAVKNAPVIDETQLGLRKTDLNEEAPPPPVEYTKAPPGQSKRFERSYQNAPPLIPHSVEGLLPITKNNNACLGCHDPKVAKAMGATPIPPTHFIDFGKLPEGKIVKLSHLDPARYNCSQCHVPQANAKPLVQNTFKPDYKDPNAKKKSKLNQELMEGVY